MQPVYLALGDSTGAGVGARSGGGYPERLNRTLGSPFRVVNLSQSGATSADVLERQLPRALRESPRLVTLGIGINDVGLQVPEDAFALTLEEIVVALRGLGAPIALLNLPDVALAPAVARLVPARLYEKRLELFNVHVTATAARHGCALVDLFSVSRELVEERGGLFSPDGFHPSAEGYEAWAEAMEGPVSRLIDAGAAALA